MLIKFGSHKLTVLYPNLCYNEVFFQGSVLSLQCTIYVKLSDKNILTVIIVSAVEIKYFSFSFIK